MLELIAFVLFQIATFGGPSATTSSQLQPISGYEATSSHLEPSWESCTDTVRIRITGNGGWGHD